LKNRKIEQNLAKIKIKVKLYDEEGFKFISYKFELRIKFAIVICARFFVTRPKIWTRRIGGEQNFISSNNPVLSLNKKPRFSKMEADRAKRGEGVFRVMKACFKP